MRILLTNDDGYRASGINAVYNALSNLGHEVVIVAPERNSSGAGQSISVYSPISITHVSEHIYFVSSTPADSVRLGLQVVYGTVDNYPDLIISGINLGENIGEDVFYSGTVGAAREGVIHGIASLAFSTPGTEFHHLDCAARVVCDLVERLANKPDLLESPFIWNINIPNKPYDKILGFEATELGMRPMHKPLEKQITPRGEIIYWQGDTSQALTANIGTDIALSLKLNTVSITPLEMLPTDYSQMPIINALTT
ncbi:MAG: 5'/3'-nucleotidase SurE [Proteobacteria bacterium]|jgi:5'-nucleotidase|nr:5'/3'-nucleotidase SurE [Pseudomonadota bacterium]